MRMSFIVAGLAVTSAIAGFEPALANEEGKFQEAQQTTVLTQVGKGQTAADLTIENKQQRVEQIEGARQRLQLAQENLSAEEIQSLSERMDALPQPMTSLRHMAF